MITIAVWTMAALSLLTASDRKPTPAVDPLEEAARAVVAAIDSEAKTEALFEMFTTRRERQFLFRSCVRPFKR